MTATAISSRGESALISPDMRESPSRLRRPAVRPLVLDRSGPATELRFPELNQRPHVLRYVRVVRRFVALLLLTLPGLPIQAVCLLVPGLPKIGFTRVYWSWFSYLLGLNVRLAGTLERGTARRRVVYVSNHSSWVDIAVLGGVLDGCFVAKREVAGWPLIGTIARLGRCVFVTRQRAATARERDTMHARLRAGDNLILFPEGTSSDGSRVLPFRSSFLAVTEATDGPPPLIQPVSIVYDRLGGLPTGRASRPVFAWYGDMDIASHFWRLGQQCGLGVTVLLHAPIDPARFADRKALSQAVWRIVADGASTLRQNRPAAPLGEIAAQASAADAEPAFA
jgi:1-acyl-sn-glycerol-3-phosphate acyltransferase